MSIWIKIMITYYVALIISCLVSPFVGKKAEKIIISIVWVSIIISLAIIVGFGLYKLWML